MTQHLHFTMNDLCPLNSVSVCTLTIWHKHLDRVYSFFSLPPFDWSQMRWWSTVLYGNKSGVIEIEQEGNDRSGAGRETAWRQQGCVVHTVSCSALAMWAYSLLITLHTDFRADDEAESWWLRGTVLPQWQTDSICTSRCQKFSAAAVRDPHVKSAGTFLLRLLLAFGTILASSSSHWGFARTSVLVLRHKHLSRNTVPHSDSAKSCFVEISEKGKQSCPLKPPYRPEHGPCFFTKGTDCTMKNVGLIDMNVVRRFKMHKMITTHQDFWPYFLLHLPQCKSLTSQIVKCHISFKWPRPIID